MIVLADSAFSADKQTLIKKTDGGDTTAYLVLLTALSYPAPNEDIQTLIKKAESGDATAQYNLAVAYEQGEVVPLDYVEAAKWYRKAAEQGHAAA